MLTAKAAEIDKIAGLELGADDYIVNLFRSKKSLPAFARFCGVSKKIRLSDTKTREFRLILQISRIVCEGADVN
jgi:DNA-binding response OmpR family regulator